MADARAKHCLVSFENVSASVGGYDISNILELHLVAAANAVPQLTLMVDAGRDGAGISQAVGAVSLSEARQVFTTGRSLVRTDAAPLSLSLTCRVEGPGGPETQTLSINGWMLTDIALSPVQYEGVCAASFTFQHPLYKAHCGGAVPELVAISEPLANVEDGNPFAVFIRALRVLAEVQRSVQLPAAIPWGLAPEEAREQLLERLSKATSDLESTLRWTHGGLPASSYLAGWSHLLCRGLSIYALPSGGNSILQALFGGLVPECSLAVGGDYTQGVLEIGPFEPWADASLSMSDSDIVSLSFPQADPSPISGVHVQMGMTASSTGVTYLPIGCQLQGGSLPAATYYIPESERSAPYLYGPLQQFAEPGWLVAMSACQNSLSDGVMSDTFFSLAGGLQTAVTTPRGGGALYGEGSGGISASLDYAQATLACAKAYFETTLMKDWIFSATARLLFSTDGGVLCPGRVLGVKSGADEVLGGYIIGVEHVISVANRTAETRVTCSHPRFGALPAAITTTTNALYT